MHARRFDALTRAFAAGLPRRRLLRGLGASGLALLALRADRGAAATQEEGSTVELLCTPCNCDGDDCECCLIGVTGGGVIKTEVGEATLVLFASRIEEQSRQAAGFVRWVDAKWEGSGLTLESVGPITYEEVPSQEQTREIRGTMQANGSGDYPFVMQVMDAGPTALGQDTASLAVGDEAAEGAAASGFGYGATGTLIGGDLQLLGTVAPIP